METKVKRFWADFKYLHFRQNVKTTWKQDGQSVENRIEFRVADGQLYLKDDQLAGGKWIKGYWFYRTDGVIVLAIIMLLDKGPQALSDPEAAKVIAKLASDPGIFRTTSKENNLFNGQPNVQITVNVDVSALIKALAKSENRPLLKALLKSLYYDPHTNDSMTINDDKLAQVEITLKMLESILQRASFSVMLQIGTKDKQLQCVCADFSTNVDPITASLIGGAAGNIRKPLMLDAEFMMTLSDIGKPVKVEPVEGAIEVRPPGSC